MKKLIDTKVKLFFIIQEEVEEHIKYLENEIIEIYQYMGVKPVTADVEYLKKVLFNLDSRADRSLIVRNFIEQGGYSWNCLMATR